MPPVADGDCEFSDYLYNEAVPFGREGSEAKWTASGRSAFLSSSGHVGDLMPHELVYHLACEKKVPKKTADRNARDLGSAGKKKKTWTPGTQKESCYS